MTDEKIRQECEDVWEEALSLYSESMASGCGGEVSDAVATDRIFFARKQWEKQARNKALEEAARKASQFSDYDLGATEDAIRALKED